MKTEESADQPFLRRGAIAVETELAAFVAFGHQLFEAFALDGIKVHDRNGFDDVIRTFLEYGTGQAGFQVEEFRRKGILMKQDALGIVLSG